MLPALRRHWRHAAGSEMLSSVLVSVVVAGAGAGAKFAADCVPLGGVGRPGASWAVLGVAVSGSKQ
eukprot:390157-Prorocentrum_lima.AAC.1